MQSWRSVLAATLACLLVAAPAAAQSAAPATTPTGQPEGGPTVPPPTPSTDAGSVKGEGSRPAAKRARSARSPVSREQVSAVQRALKERGHDPGEVDGALGPRTRAALREFQKKEGLRVTGRPDAPTLARLGVGAPSSGTSARPAVPVKPAAAESSGSTAPAATSPTPASTPSAEPKK